MMEEESTVMRVENMFQEAYSLYDSNQEWWIYAAFTDQLLLDEWTPRCDSENKVKVCANLLLELRVFCKDAEYRLIRGDIGSSLRSHICNKDDQMKKDIDYYDEQQYLDVDTKKSKPEQNYWEAKTTGGGGYTIPLSEIDDACIWIRNYMSYYEETGQAYVSDWRILQLGGVE